MLAARRALLLRYLSTGVSRAEAMRASHVTRDEFYHELRKSATFRDEVAAAIEQGDASQRKPTPPLPSVSVMNLTLIALPALVAVGLILLGVEIGNPRLAW